MPEIFFQGVSKSYGKEAALHDVTIGFVDGVTTAVGGSNFSDPAFDFQVTPAIMLAGIAFAAPF